MCFFHDFWTRAKTGLGHGTRSKWAHFGRRKCCQFSQCGHGSAAKLFSKRFRMGSLSERKFHDSWSCFLMSFFFHIFVASWKNTYWWKKVSAFPAPQMSPSPLSAGSFVNARVLCFRKWIKMSAFLAPQMSSFWTCRHTYSRFFHLRKTHEKTLISEHVFEPFIE